MTDIITYGDYASDNLARLEPTIQKRDWLVVPVAVNRDSNIMEKSNFQSALNALGGEGDFVETRVYGHFAYGWFEIIIAHPSMTSVVTSIKDRLDDYPILDEDDLSEREYESLCETWDAMPLADRIELAAKNGKSIFAARRGPFDCSDNPGHDLLYA